MKNRRFPYHILFASLFLVLFTRGVSLWAWSPFVGPENPGLRIAEGGPAAATRNQEYHYILEWTPKANILPGTQIELRSLNLRTFCMWHYTRIDIDGADVTMRRPFDMTTDYIFSVAPNYINARATIQYGLKAEDRLRIRISVVPPFHAGLNEALSIWIDRNPADEALEFEPIADAVAVLAVVAGPVERLGVYCHPTPGPDGQVRTVLAPEDRYGNAAAFAEAVDAELTWRGKRFTKSIKGLETLYLQAPRDIDRLVVRVPAAELGAVDNITNGVRDGLDYVVTGNPVWERGPEGLAAGFGEFHWHTALSGDGSGNMREGFVSARDHLNMNYCAPGDHTPYKDKWAYLIEVVDSFNEDGKFATFYGWENSTKEGHDNYYFLNPEHPVRPHSDLELHKKKPYEARDELSVLFEQLTGGQRFFAVPHHTNAVAETRRPDGTPYWYPYPFLEPDEYHRLIEVFQARGNMERNTYTDAWRGWYGWRSSVQDALNKGYKLGFTGGTDNHHNRPGFCFAAEEGYGRIPTWSRSMTGVWAKDISRRGVFDALYDRHTWAAWDTRAIVVYTVNGAMGGDEIRVPKGAPLKAGIKMSTEDFVQSLEIISGGETVWIDSIDSLDFDITAELGLAKETTYFYLRGLLRNGGIVYASPVFVTVTD